MKKIFLLLLFTFPFLSLQAAEKITKFNARAVVHLDGSVEITENITVNVEHNQIRRGIYRDIPLSARQKLDITDLQMDGAHHPYFTEKQEGSVRINFGDDRYIPRGLHTYTLRYTMRNVVGFFQDYDEIYWNVTGNDWAFPIEIARGSVTLPDGAEVLEDKISSYTGRRGSKSSRAERLGLTFQVAFLQPHEGLTVAVPFKKGLLHENKFLQTIRISGEKIWLLLLFLATLAYCFYVWKRFGKDPAAHVVRRYSPPNGISPAQARFIRQMGYDDKTLAVTLISLTEKGALKITDEKHGLRRGFIIQNNFTAKQPLAPEEEAALKVIPDQLILNGANRSCVLKIQQQLKEALRKTNEKFFNKNTRWAVPPFLLILVFFGYRIYIWEDDPIICAIKLGILVLAWWGSLLPGLKNAHWIPIPVILSLLCMAIWTTGISVTQEHPLNILDIALVFLLLFSLYWFFLIMRAYTPAGQQIMDEINGFKQYLSIGEGTRVQVSDPTDELKIFCDYLPYALALDVENEWIESFEATLTQGQIQQELSAHGLSGMDNLSSSLAGLSSACAAASSDRDGGGFSGSGGGGSSGGGFGGGGGGGR